MVRYFADIYDAVSSTFKGMGVTFKHLFRKPVTLQYPDERWVMPERFRGFVFNDVIRCNACLSCAKACPVDCIYIETEGKGRDRFMTRWAVDYNKCIWCGFCTDPCPTEAVQMSHDYDHSLYFRQRLVHEFVPPDRPVPCHKDVRREMGYFVEEKEAAEKPEKPAQPAKPAGEKPAAEKPAAAAKPTAPLPADRPATAAPAEAEDSGLCPEAAAETGETPADGKEEPR